MANCLYILYIDLIVILSDLCNSCEVPVFYTVKIEGKALDAMPSIPFLEGASGHQDYCIV